MFASRPAVHPLEVAAAPPPPAEQQEQQQQPPQQQPQPQPQPEQGVEHPQGVLMKDLPGMPGTPGALGLRIAQLLFAGISLAVMTSTNDFPSVTAFCGYLASWRCDYRRNHLCWRMRRSRNHRLD